jgi:GNAT superfamily N-acetyltransferase
MKVQEGGGGLQVAIEFRLATAEEIAILKQLIPLSVRALSQGYYRAAQVESALLYIFGVDSQLIADGTYYVAVAGDEIVGCGGWSKRKTLFGGDQMKAHADDLLDPASEPARIRAFFVHPQWVRQGIGRRIIEMCEAAARAEGFGRMELAATLPGEPLYTALGYEVTARFDVPMPDGERLPVAQMAKRLGAV